jgi:uncharacterized protein
MFDRRRRSLFTGLGERFWPFWLFHIRRLSWPILALLLVTSVIGFRYGRRIRIDTNLLHLLPSETVSLQRLAKLRDASEVKGFLTVTFETDTQRSEGDLLAQAKSLEQIIARDPLLQSTTSGVIYEMPGDFVRRYALYYADHSDLVRVRNRLKNTIDQAKRKENPYFEDLEEVAPAPFYIGDILNKYRKRYLNSSAFIDHERRSITVLISLKKPPDDIQFAQSYLSTLRDQLKPAAARAGYRLYFSGRYATDVEKQRQLASDISQSSTITLMILIVSLIIFFRSMRVILVIGLPVVAALGYTYFAAWYFIGQISIISSFLTSILLGLGIDYGIHLFSRYKSERLRGRGMTLALETTMRNLFRGLSFGMISTAAVFFTLSFSDFIAFAEFGRIALAGIIFFFVSFIVFFPALVFLTEKYSFSTTEPSHMLEKTRRIRGWHVALVLAVVGYGVATAFRPPFEYDFFELDQIESPSFRSKNLRVLENREHMVIYEFSTLQELEQVEKGFRTKACAKILPGQNVASCSSEFHSVRDLMPTNQYAKQTTIAEIHELLRQAELYSLVTLDTENLRKIRAGLRMTSAPPVTIADIPPAFRQHLVMNGKYYLYIFPKNLAMYSRGVLDFAAAYRDACVRPNSDGTCANANLRHGTSDLYVIDDILRTVIHDLSKEILLIALVIVLLVLSLTRRVAGMLLILSPLVAGIFGLFALVGAMHHIYPAWFFEFNYINLLAFPIMLGVGIDNGIYLYAHARELGLSQVNHIMTNTGASIFISNFTTAMGFLSLTISTHIGLASFGFITFMGMLCIFYAYRLLFPALARLFEKLEAEI